MMSFVVGTTSKYPSATFHFAGLPSFCVHWERSLPSNRTIASAGARPADVSVPGAPGSTATGAGRLRSCDFHFCSVCAATECPHASSKIRTINVFIKTRKLLFINISPMRSALTACTLSAFPCPSFSIFAPQKIVGLRHVGDPHIGAIINDFFAGPQRHHSQEHHFCEPRGIFERARGFCISFRRIHPIHFVIFARDAR